MNFEVIIDKEEEEDKVGRRWKAGEHEFINVSIGRIHNKLQMSIRNDNTAHLITANKISDTLIITMLY